MTTFSPEYLESVKSEFALKTSAVIVGASFIVAHAIRLALGKKEKSLFLQMLASQFVFSFICFFVTPCQVPNCLDEQEKFDYKHPQGEGVGKGAVMTLLTMALMQLVGLAIGKDHYTYDAQLRFYMVGALLSIAGFGISYWQASKEVPSESHPVVQLSQPPFVV